MLQTSCQGLNDWFRSLYRYTATSQFVASFDFQFSPGMSLIHFLGKREWETSGNHGSPEKGTRKWKSGSAQHHPAGHPAPGPTAHSMSSSVGRSSLSTLVRFEKLPTFECFRPTPLETFPVDEMRRQFSCAASCRNSWVNFTGRALKFCPLRRFLSRKCLNLSVWLETLDGRLSLPDDEVGPEFSYAASC